MNEQEKYDWMVYVSCMTYNQAQYIEDAMNGFTMQETNFPFVCAIVDDASTDGEQEVLLKYLQENFDICNKTKKHNDETEDCSMIIAQHKSNINCFFVVYFLRYNHYSKHKSKLPYIRKWIDNSKYIAFCEGDDYWIDPQKLQKQFDILEQNQDVGLVRTDINRYHQDTGMTDFCFFQNCGNRILNTHEDFIMNSWFVAPCTWMYRTDLWRTKPTLKSKKYHDGDTLSILHYSQQAIVYYLPDVTAVYRVLQNSASHFDDYSKYLQFRRRNQNTRIYYAKMQSFSFRLKFWWKIFRKERPSFRGRLKLIPRWIFDGIKDIVNLMK